MDRGLLQRDVASTIGANEWTVHNWEINAHQPETKFYPAIMNWLGFCPIQKPRSLGGLLRLHRTYRGMSASEMAKKIGVDPTTVLSWEKDLKNPKIQQRSRLKIRNIIELAHPKFKESNGK
ncbi:MAG: helix-turn-helix transcriptional regulator [Pseudomonadota bacterium]